MLRMSPNVLFGLLFATRLERDVYCVPTHRVSLGKIAEKLRAILPDAEIAFAPDAAGFEQINRMDGTRLKRDLGYTPPSLKTVSATKSMWRAESANNRHCVSSYSAASFTAGSRYCSRRGSHSAAPTRAKASAGLRSASGLGCRPSAFMSASA